MNDGRDMFNHFFFKPDSTVLLDRKFCIEGRDYYLVAVTKQDGMVTLWMFNEYEPQRNEMSPLVMHGRDLTNRESMERHKSLMINDRSIAMSEIQFGDTVLKMRSSGHTKVHENLGQPMTRIQHFIDKGLSMSTLESMNFPNVCLSQYDVFESDGLELGEIDFNGGVTIRKSLSHRTIPVNKRLSLAVGADDDMIEVPVIDPETGKTILIYIESVESFEFWAENVMENLDRRPEEMDEDQYQEWRSTILNAYEQNCPRGMNLAMVKYEVSANASGTFYETRWLDSPIISNTGSGSTFVFASTDEDVGRMGYRLMTCPLLPIEKDYDGVIEFELMHISITEDAKEYYI